MEFCVTTTSKAFVAPTLPSVAAKSQLHSSRAVGTGDTVFRGDRRRLRVGLESYGDADRRAIGGGLKIEVAIAPERAVGGQSPFRLRSAGTRPK